MTFTIDVNPALTTHPRPIRVTISNSTIVNGTLMFTHKEWECFKLILGSGAIAAQSYGIQTILNEGATL